MSSLPPRSRVPRRDASQIGRGKRIANGTSPPTPLPELRAALVWLPEASAVSDHSIQPTLIFVKSPNYKILIPFQALAERVYTADFQEEFNRAMRDMTIVTPFLAAA